MTLRADQPPDYLIPQVRKAWRDLVRLRPWLPDDREGPVAYLALLLTIWNDPAEAVYRRRSDLRQMAMLMRKYVGLTPQERRQMLAEWLLRS